MSKRKSMSKSLRFEIFKRDGFRCLYCGVTPTQAKLRVDHVNPVAKGGTDAPENLITSCFDCNAGKAARPLEARRFKTEIATEADKEHAEQIREWLRIQREVTEARSAVVDDVAEEWRRAVGELSKEMFARIPKLVREWPMERLVEAIQIVGDKKGSIGEPYDYRTAKVQQKYFYGVLRNWREAETRPEPVPEPPKRSERAARILSILNAVATQPGASVRHVIERFWLEAFGRESDEPGEFDPDLPQIPIRGLVLSFKPASRPNSFSWTVEDDAGWAPESDWYETFKSTGFGVRSACMNGGDASGQLDRLLLEMTEAMEFAAYLRGAPGALEGLRAAREKLGLDCPGSQS